MVMECVKRVDGVSVVSVVDCGGVGWSVVVMGVWSLHWQYQVSAITLCGAGRGRGKEGKGGK